MSVLTCLTCGVRLYRHRAAPKPDPSQDPATTAFSMSCDCTDPLLQLHVRIDATTTSIMYGSLTRWSENGETFPEALWIDDLSLEQTPTTTYGPFGEDLLD